MNAPWLHVVGIGEDGLDGLSSAAAGLVRSAEVIVGGARHHRLTDGVDAERVSWPQPFNALVPELEARKGRRVVVLVTGDPFWFSAGVNIARALEPEEVLFHPHVSAFQLAAARMGWPMENVQTLTVHGRPLERVARYLAPGAPAAGAVQRCSDPIRTRHRAVRPRVWRIAHDGSGAYGRGG